MRSLLLVVCVATNSFAGESIIDPTFVMQKVADNCAFTEGPVVADDGVLYFSDAPNDRIMQVVAGQQATVLIAPCGAANGLLLDGQGRLLMCQSARNGGGRALARYDLATQHLETLTDKYNGRRYIAPNDLTIDRRGRIYFTDPYYDGDKSQPTSGVYRYDPDGTVTLLITELLKPNGILITPDNKFLYVSDRGTQRLHRYRVTAGGRVAADRVVYDFWPDRGIDGMTMDVAGNIYAAAGEGPTTGLFVISANGQLLLHKRTPEFATNVTFGGADRRDLYITASTSVYRFRTRLAGARWPHRSASIFASRNPRLVLEDGAGEGPAWHPQLGLFFSGNGGVNRLTTEGQSVPFDRSAQTNGLLFDCQGRMLRCESTKKQVTRRSSDGQVEVLSREYAGQPFNQPNDITADSHGRIYFSDPKYGPRKDLRQRDGDGRAIEGVYRIDPDGSTHRIITHEVDRPNGVLVSLDDRYLFVADNNNNTSGGARLLWRFNLENDGTVDFLSKRLLHDWGTGRGPDGLAQDTAGRVYVAAGLTKPTLPHETVDPFNRGGIYVFSPAGALLDFVPIPRDEVTNCTFGGPELKTLYITAGGTLWSMETTTPGFSIAPK